jgi:hypothetical protein
VSVTLPDPTDHDDARWEPVDACLLDGERIRAFVALRASFDLGIRDGVDLLPRRVDALWERDPAAFTVPIAGYWDGVYT